MRCFFEEADDAVFGGLAEKDSPWEDPSSRGGKGSGRNSEKISDFSAVARWTFICSKSAGLRSGHRQKRERPMRRLITKSILGVFAVLLLASSASAATIPIGWLQWDASLETFSVVNQTGANYLGDPAFPVTTQITFDANMNLAIEDGNRYLQQNSGRRYFSGRRSFVGYPV